MKKRKVPLNKKEQLFEAALKFAERAGFEPAVPFPVRQFSKLFLSATQAPLRYCCANITQNFYFAKLFFAYNHNTLTFKKII